MKPTFATLKKLARQDRLEHNIRSEYDGMIDGLSYSKEENFLKTTIEDISYFKCSKNYIKQLDETTISLLNCCFSIVFRII